MEGRVTDEKGEGPGKGGGQDPLTPPLDTPIFYYNILFSMIVLLVIFHAWIKCLW